ncbi:MAG: hypothetical protein AB8C84_07665 [Oligoflexales bacterium]
MTDFELEEQKPKTHYCYLIINKTYRSGLAILCTVYYGICFALVYQLLQSHHQWTTLGLPLGGLGLLFLVYPATENWHYAPWQTRPQKLERHYRG